MGKEKNSRRSVWTKQSFEKEKLAVRDEVKKATEKEGVDALKYCLNQIAALNSASAPLSQLRRFIFVIKSLSEHALSPSLSPTDVKYLSELAEAILRSEGVQPVSSSLAFLYGDLHLVMSEIYRRSGQQWAAAWEQHLAGHLSQKSLSVGVGAHYMALGVRAFRLGHTDLALENFSRASQCDLNTDLRGRNALERMRCYRLMGDGVAFCQLATELDSETLPAELRLEIGWERLCHEVQIGGDVTPLVKAVTRKNSPYIQSYVLEAFLWTRSVRSRKSLKDFPSLRSLNPKEKFSSKEQGIFYQLCKSIESCYDFEMPYAYRFQKHGRLLSRISQLETIDKELLVWGATVRWLSRGRAPDVTQLCLKQYQALSRQLTQGRATDALGILADIGSSAHSEAA